MKHEKLAEALDAVRDAYIANAANVHKRRIRPRVFGGIAAVLALVLLVLAVVQPLSRGAEAVSLAKYPKYEWQRRPEAVDYQRALQPFFSAGIREALTGQTENAAFSPVALYLALAGMAELTRSDTRAQILSALGSDDPDALRAEANTIWNATYLDDGNRTLLAGSIWLDERLSYDQATMDRLAQNYYTSVYRTALGSDRANRAIAKWLDGQTKGLLRDATKGIRLASDPPTVFAYYSTIYYRAKWSEAFSKSANTDGVFHAAGEDIPCTFLNRHEANMTYCWSDDFGAVSLDLKDGSRMWLFLPDDGKSVDDVLSASDFSALALSEPNRKSENSRYVKVNLALPKFDIQASSDLRGVLESMGISDLFDPAAADFGETVSGMSPVWVTGVNQATRVAVDEEGVTAASYLELPAAGAAEPPEEIIDFILDRPFVFVLANRYGLPLFAGVVNAP